MGVGRWELAAGAPGSARHRLAVAQEAQNEPRDDNCGAGLKAVGSSPEAWLAQNNRSALALTAAGGVG